MESLKPASLPRLKVFSFEGPTATCLAFIESLELPHCARRDLTVTHGKPTTSEALVYLRNELVSELAKWESHFSSAVLTASDGVGFMAWKQPQSAQDLEHTALDEYCTTCSADLQVYFVKTSHDNPMHDAVHYELLLAHVQTLVLPLRMARDRSRPSEGSIDAPTFFAHLNELKVMSCVFLEELFDNRKPHMLADLNKWNTPLPQLQVLRLHRFPFVEEIYNDLFALCQERHKTGGKLDVHLRSCREVSEAEVKQLRGMNISVDWDEQNPP